MMNNGASGASFESFYPFASFIGGVSSRIHHEKPLFRVFCGVWGGFFLALRLRNVESNPNVPPASLIGGVISRLHHEKIPVQSFLEGLGTFFPKKVPNVPPLQISSAHCPRGVRMKSPQFKSFLEVLGTFFGKKVPNASPRPPMIRRIPLRYVFFLSFVQFYGYFSVKARL